MIEWLNSWPTTMQIMEWLDPRVVWLGAAIGILGFLAKHTPWKWDDVFVGALQQAVSLFSRKKPPKPPADDKP